MGSVITVPQGLDSQLTQLDTPVRRNQAAPRIVPVDPRIFQILFLGVLLAAGARLRDFSLQPPQIVLTFAAALGTQHTLSRMHGHLPVSYRSALITVLGLTLLLRSDTLWAHPLAATAAISSKFLFRWKRKHVFNPANFGVILALCALPGTWVSPGQWGQDITFAGWLLMLGAVVSHRARRADISWSFLVIYLGLIAIRVAWLGQRWAVWTHQFGNGALLLFAFFMISDPMTIPNSRDGRLVHAAIVAIFACTWQFEFYRINGFLWALICAAPLVPVWDVLWPARKFEWTVQGGNEMSNKRIAAARRVAIAVLVCTLATTVGESGAWAFCGFYVGKADAALYNHASQVVYVRNGDRNVISIMNDYEGEPSEFALVVPVPVALHQDQIHVGDRELFTHLDSYSSPRLVEYYDPDPCPRMMGAGAGAIGEFCDGQHGRPHMEKSRAEMAKSLGVTIEATYTVGEYDIEILSATQSQGLETYLVQSGYKVPLGAHHALQPYIRQNLKFFVAKVNLKERARTGLSYLRPIQFALDSPRFMLPIRLGMMNAQGPQDLIIYLLTPNGRVETTNYRTVKLPTGMDLPAYIRDDFGGFYKAMFGEQVTRNEMSVVFSEYVWNLGLFCDPCSAPPLSAGELRQLGVFWINTDAGQSGTNPGAIPYPGAMQGLYEGQGPGQVIFTRLHVRYSAATFPEDLMFQETQDTENFQVRYVLRHPWTGSAESCPAAQSYSTTLRQRRQTEAMALADLTGWQLDEIYRKEGIDPAAMTKPAQWWQGLWK
jgi:Na+-translocating ferredoxin:NAD+ oxidoreductase RnfD subunit